MTKATIGITGANGFIGAHLAERLRQESDFEVLTCPRQAFEDPRQLRGFVRRCQTIIHLAAMNRGNDEEIYRVNTELVAALVSAMEAEGTRPHVVFSSSTQEDLDNTYGKSKREGRRLFEVWSSKNDAPLTLLLIPNVFGPGCRPFYNSVVATFCHQLTHGELPRVLQDRKIVFTYVNDLADEIVGVVKAPRAGVGIHRIQRTTLLSVTQLLEILQSFHDDYFHRNVVPSFSCPLHANLYATFLSYLRPNDLCHRPEKRSDARGHLFEIIKLDDGGQFFFSTTKPGVIRGNHYHRRKIELFCVLRGEAVIRLRRLGETEVREFRVSGEYPEFVSIPVHCAHLIENVGDQELLTLFWSNEIFDAADPDTFPHPVFPPAIEEATAQRAA
jgi:UDP-2-acetamido-2,6-beta-L-arabino-hexul-4-ose reductase